MSKRGRPSGQCGLSPEQLKVARRLYEEEQKSTHTIARELGLTQETVRVSLIRAGVLMRRSLGRAAKRARKPT